MRKLVLVIVLMTCYLVLVVGNAGATHIVTFDDNTTYWPGWNNGSGDDNKDSIGIPNFTGGFADVNANGALTNLTFNQSITSSSFWSVISPGDLFIDTNSDQSWDYIVDLTSWDTAGKGNEDPATGNYNIHFINLALDDSSTNGNYILSGSDNSGGWSGCYIRDDHPVAYGGTLPETAYGQVGFSGWDNVTPATTYSFDFTGLNEGGLGLGQDFTIGWAPNCANDVVYETIPNPAPEPATMLLLGTGLIGLGWIGRKKTKNSSRA